MIKTIVFDWDGTLHNTEALYGNAFRHAYAWLVSQGYAEDRLYTDKETSIYLGMSAPAMWEAFMPHLPSDIKETASAMIGQAMDEYIYQGKATLYDGVPEVLDELKSRGFKLVILSNCRVAYLDAHREFFGLDRWFDGYYPAQQYDFISKEEIFELIRKSYPGDYAMVGDREADMKVASMSDVYGIGCLYGFGSREELSSANALVHDIAHIVTYVI